MEFFIQTSSSLPAHAQLRDQVKVALLLGHLRPGDTLPSIRDLERDLGVSPTIVRRAYGELEELGILKMIHGKGVMVNKALKYKQNTGLLEECGKLVELNRQRCESLGLILSSFTRFQQHMAAEVELSHPPLVYVDLNSMLAAERARRLSEILAVNTRGLSTEELPQSRKALGNTTKVVCNYYRFGEVSRILSGRKIKIVPLRMTYGAALKEELGRLPKGAKVMFVADDVDKSAMPLVLEDYKRAFPDQHLEVVLHSSRNGVARLIKSNTYAKFIVSNRIWDKIPPEVQGLPTVIRPILEFDPASIEESKIEMGILS